MNDLLTKDAYLNAEEGFVFYFYDRNTHMQDDPSFYVMTCTVTETEGERVAEGVNAGPGMIQLPLTEAVYDDFNHARPFGKTLFTTKEAVVAQYAEEQRKITDAYATLSKEDTLRHLFDGWYGEFDRSDAEMEGMLTRMTELFDVTRTDITSR